MDYFEDLARLSDDDLDIPEWARANDRGKMAFVYTEKAKQERLAYILKSTKRHHFKAKKTWHIFSATIAMGVGLEKSYLSRDASFAPEFRSYLSKVNAELEVAKNNRLLKVAENRGRGRIAEKKEVLVSRVRTTEQRLKEQESVNAAEVVRLAAEKFSPLVRDLLMIEDRRVDTSNKVVPLRRVIESNDE
ncbi:hypothetical protein [Congregibacter litoralis]|uniref:Uncharacterized protein n=1 Tax=Congregibacter litoralis KT71 TaxID=314285 RepID=A4A3A5_9GAMM|nr:hypothetical protein [Congregibacter litoralis]EAQ99178.1 hypothetical protein KT71_15951 [Congregibacter litoralis KT71]